MFWQRILKFFKIYKDPTYSTPSEILVRAMCEITNKEIEEKIVFKEVPVEVVKEIFVQSLQTITPLELTGCLDKIIEENHKLLQNNVENLTNQTTTIGKNTKELIFQDNKIHIIQYIQTIPVFDTNRRDTRWEPKEYQYHYFLNPDFILIHGNMPFNTQTYNVLTLRKAKIKATGDVNFTFTGWIKSKNNLIELMCENSNDIWSKFTMTKQVWQKDTFDSCTISTKENTTLDIYDMEPTLEYKYSKNIE